MWAGGPRRTQLDEAVAYFLDLRVGLRRQSEARAIVDRCLLLLARAADADAAECVRIEREIEALSDELAARFGAPRAPTRP